MVKRELGIAYFVFGKGRFHSLERGSLAKNNPKLEWIKISAIQPLGLWNLCTWTLEFSQNMGWEMGLETLILRTLLVRSALPNFFSKNNCFAVLPRRVRKEGPLSYIMSAIHITSQKR